MHGVADLEEFLAFAESLAVEENLLLAAAARTPAIERMLSTFAIALVIAVGPVGRGRLGVILLDAPPHFRDEGLAQRLGGRERLLAMGVLGFEQAGDIAGQGPRIAQGFPPILSREPCVIVLDDAAVEIAPHRLALRRRRRRLREGGGRIASASSGHETSPQFFGSAPDQPSSPPDRIIEPRYPPGRVRRLTASSAVGFKPCPPFAT
jgi:hypothetical protein